VWERANDAAMKRTQRRPLPSGRISAPAALAFGGALTAAAGGVLLAGTNPLTAALGLGNIALYALVYTPLKTRSELNTAVGALVGVVTVAALLK
jgi:heme O synthase-like polyprenyltransferase